MRLAIIACACVIVGMACCGCGRNGPECAIVSGTVTYQGQPLPEGDIRFVPADRTQRASSAQIRDGKYQAGNKGGVPVGRHRVEIVADRVNPKYKNLPSPAWSPVPVSPPHEQYIPEKYNTQSELTIDIAPGSGKITANYELKP